MVAVQTNCGYEPVMMAIIKDETADTVKAALHHLKEISDFSPNFIMMDDSAAYQKAAKQVFPG